MSANHAKNANSTGKKKGGGFLARQARQARSGTDKKTVENTITEEEILQKENVSPDDVLALNKITESEKPESNNYF